MTGVVLAGCGAADAPARVDASVPCSARVEPPPTSSLEGRDGVTTSKAALPGGGRFAVFSFAGAPTRVRLGGRRVWAWKTPAELSAGRSVVMTVAPASARRARLGFSRPARSFRRAPRSARFTACPADEPLFSGEGTVGPVTGWAGSLITLDRRTCLRLTVREGRAAARRLAIPLGRSCRG